MIYERPRFLPGGDRAMFVEFGSAIDPELNRRVRGLLLAIRAADLPGVVETVPTYRSLLVYYEPRLIHPAELRDRLETLTRSTRTCTSSHPKVTEVPTVYGGEYGPDLDFVAGHNGVSREELIRFHSQTTYLIYMLGFMPGFAYLGGMDTRIAAPRLPTPRPGIPAGSVGIAGDQTGIYPAESPAGWQIIGRTPIELFKAADEPPALLQMGDYVRFVPIDVREFKRIRQDVEHGTYRVNEAPLTHNGEHGDV